MAKLIWHSTSPWAASGYGQQTALWARKLTEMGHEVTISSYWGLNGAPTFWNGIAVLPGFGANYCSVSLAQHAQVIQPDLIITLGDVWVMDPNLLKPLPVAHWLPADTRPMSYADRAEVAGSGARLIAMSRFGYERFTSAGFDCTRDCIRKAGRTWNSSGSTWGSPTGCWSWTSTGCSAG